MVAKRLDRIEFMVLSALNEVPPQNKPHYLESRRYTDTGTDGDDRGVADESLPFNKEE